MSRVKVNVESEFAPLKRVVLTQSEFILGTDVVPEDYSFLEESNSELLDPKTDGGKNYRDIYPERQKLWEQERENLLYILEKYNIEVLRPRLLTDHEKNIGKKYGTSNFFARDPFFTIGTSIIEGGMRFFYRRTEVLTARSILENEAADSDCMYVAIPTADTSLSSQSEHGPFLEGGDILVLGKTIFVGNSGNASNHNGYLWLKKYLKNWDYEVIELKLHKEVLHLDCALSFVKQDLMIICEEAFIHGIPEQLASWQRIDVPFSDVKKLAINGLPINEEVYIVDKEFDYIGKQLEEHGVKPEYLDFKISRSLGGSFRCSTQPLLRTQQMDK